MTKVRTHTAVRPQKSEARRVSKPHDKHEREAERAAEVVARGGSVSSWSFSSVPAAAEAPVQRQEVVKEKTDEEKKQEALKKAGEAALATKEGQALKEKVLADPLVKSVTDAVTSTPGLIAGGAALAGGVVALGATGKELPIQPPEIPGEKISPKLAGISAKVTWEGPVFAPTNVGLLITVKEQGPKKKDRAAPDPIQADIARLKAQEEMFRKGRTYVPGSKEAEEERLLDQAVQNYVLSRSTLPGFTIPLTPPAPAKKEEEQKPAQPAPASPSAAPPAHANVDAGLGAPGRPLDPSTRRAMEARFGYDFSSVRVHDDARAAATAADVDAAAFTVGEDVVFAAGRFDPSSPEGRHLLAHELAHVVQQSKRPGGPGPVQRRSVFETLGILLGIEEGTWEDRELHQYLEGITQSGRIEGRYDSDNKARAIVRRWRASESGFDLLPAQKILLIQEMLDGPTLGEDEEAILDLLELSDASDLRVMFGTDGLSLPRLESDINFENRRRLDAWVADRFDGGREAVLAGIVDIAGDAVPAGAPAFGFDADILDARFDSDRTAEELIQLISAMDETDRRQALHHLVTVRRPRLLDRVQRLRRAFDDETNAARQEAIRRVGREARQVQLKTERVILHFFRERIPATEADLRHGTSPTDPSRQAELREALRPPRRTVGGAVPDFEPTLPGETESYEDKVRAELPTIVNDAFDSLVVGHGPTEHADTSQTHSLLEFEAIGNVAKDETDAVFGRFYSADAHPALIADVPELGVVGTVHDQFADTEARLAQMDDDQRAQMAKQLVFYFFQTEDVIRRLNHDHNAAPEFDDNDLPLNDEAIMLDNVATDFVADTANVTRLNEIDRNWPAAAQDREIFFQLFRGDTPEADRLLLWDVFQTFIHEYLHTLSHGDYDDFAGSFGRNSNEFNTLIEGVDSLLTEIVWDAVEPRVGSQELREAVEGPTNAALPAIRVPDASARRYPSYSEALRLADLVGIRNIYAAYFLGLVDRIGGTPPPAAPGAGAGP